MQVDCRFSYQLLKFISSQVYATLKIADESEVDGLYCRGQLKCDGTRAENRFRLSAKRTSQFKSAWGVSSVDYWQPRCAHQR